MSTLLQDVRFALRTMRRRWMVTVLAVLSLSLAIGGNAAVFSLVDAFILRPLPYPEPERVVLVGERQKDQPEFSGQFTMSLASARDFRERSRTVAEWAVMRPRTMSLRGTERAEAVSTVSVTPSFFSVLRAPPARGRLFTPEEAVEGGRRVALLGSEYVEANYGPDFDPLGLVLTLNGEPFEVIGVMPEGFGFLTPNQDVWLPLTDSPDESARDQRNVFALGRLRSEETMDQVREEMLRISSDLEAEFSETQRGWTVDTYNLRYDIPTRQTRVLFGMLQGSVILVLIIACVNITNLLLARGQERSREIALRTVLGAGRGRIVRQLLTESSLMVLGGAVVGVGLAAFGIRAMAAQFAGALPPGFEVVLDHRVLLFTMVISVVSGLMFGLAPALQTFKQGHAETLKEGGGRGGIGRSKKTLSRVLVVGEIALSFVALGGGSLLVRSFLEIQSSDPGFEAGPVLTSAVRVPDSKYPEDSDRALLNEQIVEAASGVSGIEAAALASTLPQSPVAATDTFRVEGAPFDAGANPPRGVIVRASPAYLTAMDIDLVLGRFFEDGDRLDAPRVAAVNRTLAEARFSGSDPIGQRLLVRGESREIIGVVEDVQQVLLRTGGAESGETVYLPTGQLPKGASFLIVRTSGMPREAAEPLRAQVGALDPDLTLSQTLTMDEYVDQFLVGVQVFNAVLGGFGLVALLLASLGTYGVLAYSVSRRGHEIGIRMAMGAQSRQVVQMIARQGFWLGVTGLGLGALMTLPLVGVLRSLLEGLSTVEPSTLVLIAAILFGVTMVASLVPASRAASVEPVRTLRDQ